MLSNTGNLKSPPITGRCYCGQRTVSARALPQITTYCHCTDCRRITGGPFAAFCGFGLDVLDISPDPSPSMSINTGVTHWFCRNCGSALAAHYEYLQEQLYVPIGILDQAADLESQMHCFADAKMPWLHIKDDLDRHIDSGSDALQKGAEQWIAP